MMFSQIEEEFLKIRADNDRIKNQIKNLKDQNGKMELHLKELELEKQQWSMEKTQQNQPASLSDLAEIKTRFEDECVWS